MTTLPTGTIISFVGSDLNGLPAQWLLCDGRPLSPGDYPGLSKALNGAFGIDPNGNFYLPDLRGMFLRGVTGDSSNDPDAASRQSQPNPGASNKPGNTQNNVGSVQLDAFANHSHALGSPFPFGSNGVLEIYLRDGPIMPNATGFTGGSETRPKNVYVYYLIYAG